MKSITEAIDQLSAEIGDNIYMDIAKWHLYLKDANLAKPLAEKFYQLISDRTLSPNSIDQILQTTLIPLGGGNYNVALADLIPAQNQTYLLQLLEDYSRQL